MKFNEIAFQDYLESSQKRASELITKTDWIYTDDGCFVSPKGFGFCVTCNAEDGYAKVWASKNKNFEIIIDQNGSHLSKKSADTSYLIHVAGISDKLSVDIDKISRAMEECDDKLADRAGHYRYLGVAFTNDPIIACDVKDVSFGPMNKALFNIKGYNLYTQNQNTHRVDLVRSIYRKDDHFNPIHLNNNYYKNGFSSLTHNLYEGADPLDAVRIIDAHRRETSQRTWEQFSLYNQQDIGFSIKAHMAQPFNYIHGITPEKKIATVAVGTGFFVAGHGVGWLALVGSVAYAGFHEELHRGAERLIDAFKIMTHRAGNKIMPNMTRRLSSEKSVRESYLEGGKNMIFGRRNVYKMFPKATAEACAPQRNLMLPERYVNKLAKLLLAKKVDEPSYDSLEDFLLKMHQLNLPGKKYRLDAHMDGFEYDNGVCGIRYDNPKTGDIVIMAHLNENLNTNELLLLPSEFKDQMNGDIAYFECNISDGKMNVKTELNHISRSEAVDFIKNRLLFKHQFFMPDAIRGVSEETVLELFPYIENSPYEDYYQSWDIEPRNKSIGVSTYPLAEAVLSYEDLNILGVIEANDNMLDVSI